jgi:hypothetical protein
MASEPSTAPTGRPVTCRPPGDPGRRVDVMCEGSFPASDPPAVWTWEVVPETGSPEEGEPVPAVSDRG